MLIPTSRRELGWALCLPFDEERSRRAARQVLDAADPSSLLGALYPVLTSQKGLTTALAHLERAGADLRTLAVPTAVARASFPLSRKLLWPAPPEPQWALDDLARVLARHRQLLWEAPLELARRRGPERMVLLSGRAMEALYPTHAARLGFDTDLWFPDLDSGLETLEVLIRDLGFTLENARLESVRSQPRMVAAVNRQVEGFDVSVGILAGGFHFYPEPLDQRSVEVEWESQRLRAPSPEDLLVMVAVGVRKKRSLLLPNVADAAVILRGGRPLDLARVRQLTGKYQVELPLGLLLAHVGALWPGTVPAELRDLTEAVPRLPWLLTRGALSARYEDPTWLLAKAAFEATALRRVTPPAKWGHIGSVLARRSARRIVRWQNSIRIPLGIRPLAPPSRDASRLSLCGAASPQITGSLPHCVGRRPGMRWDDQATPAVRAAADRLLALVPAERHRCRQFNAMP